MLKSIRSIKIRRIGVVIIRSWRTFRSIKIRGIIIIDKWFKYLMIKKNIFFIQPQILPKKSNIFAI